MPLYEYKCSVCGKVFEIMQRVNDPPLKKCPACQGKVTKLISVPAIQFKGNGWYITDYARKKPPSGQGKKEKPGSKKQEKKGSEKSSPSSSKTL